MTVLPWMLVVSTFGQGTVEFVNIHAGYPLNAPVYEADGITRLSGSQFLAELFAGPDATNLASIATTSFFTGSMAGYFNGGVVAINSVGYGHFASVQVDVWNTAFGATFNQAQASGLPDAWWQSSIFSVQTSNPGPTPTPPGELIGLGTSPVFLNGVVPEPSTSALCVVGAVAALFRFRRAKAPSFSVQENLDD